MYDYNQEELDALNIIETKRTNRDDIVYIATEIEEEIRDIYLRKAECWRDETVVKMFILPQFVDRFSTLNRICADRRSADDSLKTQIRLGHDDLIVLMKRKENDEPYMKEDLASFTDKDTLPAVDMTVKWRMTDHPGGESAHMTVQPTGRKTPQDQPQKQQRDNTV